MTATFFIEMIKESLKYPKHIKSKTAKVGWVYFQHMYWFNLGKNFCHTFISPLTQIGVILASFKFIGILEVTRAQFIWIMVVTLVGFWILGQILYRLKLDKIRILVSERRSLLNAEVHKKVVNEVEEL